MYFFTSCFNRYRYWIIIKKSVYVCHMVFMVEVDWGGSRSSSLIKPSGRKCEEVWEVVESLRGKQKKGSLVALLLTWSCTVKQLRFTLTFKSYREIWLLWTDSKLKWQRLERWFPVMLNSWKKIFLKSFWCTALKYRWLMYSIFKRYIKTDLVKIWL